jgi:hypothetical protein
MKVAICTPTPGTVTTSFMLSLLSLLADPRGHRIYTLASEGSVIHRQRNWLVEQVLKTDADYILWLDSDQTFPPDTLARLVAHQLPFVACNVPRRRPPFTPTAIMSDGTTVWTTLEKVQNQSVEPVDLIGLGVALTATSLFRGLKTPFPSSGEAGEDIAFCRQVAERGVRPFIDHALSWEIGHVGLVEISHRDALRERRGNADTVQPSAGAQ